MVLEEVFSLLAQSKQLFSRFAFVIIFHIAVLNGLSSFVLLFLLSFFSCFNCSKKMRVPYIVHLRGTPSFVSSYWLLVSKDIKTDAVKETLFSHAAAKVKVKGNEDEAF